MVKMVAGLQYGLQNYNIFIIKAKYKSIRRLIEIINRQSARANNARALCVL